MNTRRQAEACPTENRNRPNAAMATPHRNTPDLATCGAGKIACATQNPSPHRASPWINFLYKNNYLTRNYRFV
jgi:hypothetical protein